MDEVAHLPAGVRHWQFGEFSLYPVNPPLVRMIAAIPLVLTGVNVDWSRINPSPQARSEFAIGRDFITQHGIEAYWYFTLCRWACIPLSLLGGYFCYRWAAELYGTRPGLVALTLWCFSPEILGNAAMITPDAGAAALGIVAAYAFWRWLQRADWPHAFAAGMALGLAELTKTTWIVLFALWPTLWLLQIGTIHPLIIYRRYRASAAQLLTMLVLAIYAINLGYGFEGTWTRLKDYTFVSHSLAGTGDHRLHGNRFAESALGDAWVPLPRNYVQGIDVQKTDFERKKWSYLRGEHRFGGWWYYYIYAAAVKMPLGTLLLLPLCIATLPCRPLRTWKDHIVVLAPLLCVFVLVSSQTGFNRYFRYVLPGIPFAFVWVSQLAAPREAPGASLWTTRLTFVLVAWSVTSSLSIFPHGLSYFNELTGGPIGGPRHLLDASVDWGQDLLYLKRWMTAHPDARPLHLAYYGLVDPRSAGIDYEAVPRAGEHDLDSFDVDRDLQPGWYAISVNHVYGYRHARHSEPWYAYFQRLRPVAQAGYSIYIYHIAEPAARAQDSSHLD